MKFKICVCCKKKFFLKKSNNPNWKNNWKARKYCNKKCQLRIKSIKRYYKHRHRQILKQRKWDKENKDKKRIYDKKKYPQKKWKYTLYHNQKKYYDKLLKKYKGCQICGSTKKLQIHHKKYINNIKNLMLLCLNCHKKIHRKYNF